MFLCSIIYPLARNHRLRHIKLKKLWLMLLFCCRIMWKLSSLRRHFRCFRFDCQAKRVSLVLLGFWKFDFALDTKQWCLIPCVQFTGITSCIIFSATNTPCCLVLNCSVLIQSASQQMAFIITHLMPETCLRSSGVLATQPAGSLCSPGFMLDKADNEALFEEALEEETWL